MAVIIVPKSRGKLCHRTNILRQNRFCVFDLGIADILAQRPARFPLDKLVDMVLIMTVEPGYGGQAFMPEMLDKIRPLKAEIDRRGLSCDIQVDGGINAETAKDAVAAGANILVAGSAVFKATDRRAVIEQLRG